MIEGTQFEPGPGRVLLRFIEQGNSGAILKGHAVFKFGSSLVEMDRDGEVVLVPAGRITPFRLDAGPFALAKEEDIVAHQA